MAKTPKERRVRRDEALLWRHVIDGVTPLGDGRIPAREDALSEEPATANETDRSAPPLLRPPPSQAQDLPRLVPGTVAGIDKRTAARLKRGQVPIEGRLDLHGQTQAEAHRELGDFLADAQDGGRRCVLVITGKGRGAAGGGVLRAAVPRWLNEPGWRERIVTFCYATPRDGGEGALYVMLRRRK